MDAVWLSVLTPSFHWTGTKSALHMFKIQFPKLATPEEKKFKSCVSDVQALTIVLAKHRYYCPNRWDSRAVKLLKLGFPDLAAGDAFKALTLLRKINGNTELDEIGKGVWKNLEDSLKARTFGLDAADPTRAQVQEYAVQLESKIVLTLAQALFLCNCFIDCIETIKEYDGKDNSNAVHFNFIKMLANTCQDSEDLDRIHSEEHVAAEDLSTQEQRNAGTLNACTYPWMAHYLGRSASILLAAVQSIHDTSHGLCALRNSQIRESRFERSGYLEMTAKVLGVIAAANVNQDVVLLVDRTSISRVDNNEKRCSSCRGKFDKLLYEPECCAAKFCGQHCQDQAVKLYHNTTCKDISMQQFLNLSCKSSSPEKLAWLDMLYRVLACAEDRPWQHPLHTPVLSQMTPPSYNIRPILFSFSTDIKLIFGMLEHLGVDIYKDHGFDTWVLQTIQARLRNNTRDYEDEFGQYHCVANLSYAFFNHSCEPNVWIDPDVNGSSTLRIVTREPIAMGEELYVSYLPEEDLKLNHKDRQALLRSWTGDRCHCPKCQYERDAMVVHSPKSPPKAKIPAYPVDRNEGAL